MKLKQSKQMNKYQGGKDSMSDPTTPNKCGSGETMQLCQPSLIDSLKSRQLRAKTDLDKLNEAVEALENNPEIASVIEKITQVRGL